MDHMPALAPASTDSHLTPHLRHRSWVTTLPAMTPIEPVMVPGSATMVRAGSATK